jgi:hypothetical protein
MEASKFTVNFDYRCPFARNANEHIMAALDGGAAYDVQFKAFSLSQVHVADGEESIWHDAAKRSELTALAAGIVVRDKFPDLFRAAHRSLFALRHDDGEDLRDDDKVRGALERAGVDTDVVFGELDAGWPFEVVMAEHEESVAQHQVFGVPTFIFGDQAVFVRLMTRPAGDAELAQTTINEVLALLTGSSHLNEYKHTTVPR